jgi:uncharacterized membrane protein
MMTLKKHVWTMIAGIVSVSAPASATALPSFACSFTEPFVSLQTSPVGVHIATQLTSTTLAPAVFQTDGEKVTLASGANDAFSFKLIIVKDAGSDGMSDFAFPYAGTLTIPKGIANQTGGCVKLADGTTPRQVTNLTNDNRLNIRSAPNSRARIINTLAQGGLVWAYPEDRQGNWVRVSSILYPRNDQGDVRVVNGWAHGRYLGDLTSER